MLKSTCRQALVATVLLFSGLSAQAAFDIHLSFDGSLPEQQKAFFTAAESFWESAITGYQVPGAPLTLNIQVSAPTLDPGLLGQAGPNGFTLAQGGYVYANSGVMQFNSLYLTSLGASFGNVVLHEMAHVIGFGTLWDQYSVVESIQGGNFGYVGTAGLATFKSEFNQPNAIFIPLEQGGGPGTALAHWDEDEITWAPTGIHDAQGRDFGHELMTGWLDSPTFVSQTTIASFSDIGYTVNISAVPEPSGYLLWLAGLPLMLACLQRRKQQLH